MKRIRLQATVLALVAVGALVASAQEREAAASGAAALVGDRRVELRQLEERVQGRLIAVRNQEYALMRQTLDVMIAEHLVAAEAAARGVTIEALLRQEIAGRVPDVTPAEAKAVWEASPDRFPAMTEADAVSTLTRTLRQQREQKRRVDFVAELRRRTPVRVLIEPPRAEIDLTDVPVRGDAKAPITIVEFGDYQCPYCVKSVATMTAIKQKYGNAVRFAFRDLPLPVHKDAVPAAEAAACAGDQGEYWRMHDKLFGMSPSLESASLMRAATEVGLDADRFKACLAAATHRASIERSAREAGDVYGLRATPAFFVNGRLLNGALPLQTFVDVIDEELARAGVPVAASASN
jgi:protein-disulfide isomerase